MMKRWTLLVLILVAVFGVSGDRYTDEEYHEMPPLFHLDDYERCLSNRGAFCMGTFELLDEANPGLMHFIRNFSEDKFHFNHTKIHRGLCLSHCSGQGAPLQRFQQCVDNQTYSQYGVLTNLTKLNYCTTTREERTVDGLDMGFAWICLAILLMNLLGTAYDVFRDTENKPNKLLMCWSLCANWNRLTADYSDGDPRLNALKPLNGMKSLTLILVILAHSVLAYHITYILNPIFLEKNSHHPMSAYFQNGTSIVQTFILIGNFIVAYNLLLYSEGSKKPLSLAMYPKTIMHRITRISPVYLFVLGLTVTWWVHAGSGPLWSPLVGEECVRCRDKWWAQALFINNFIRPELRCLIHTWYLAVDVQLFIITSALVLLLGNRPRLALKVLPVIFCLTVAGNFAASYYFELKPMVTLMFPEYMHTQFENEDSFSWLYQAPWDSFPAALVGLFVAFLHYHLQSSGFKAGDSWVVRTLYRLSVPLMFLWVVGGYFMKGVTDPVQVSLYAALDRPVFSSLTAVAMYGFINKIDSLWWSFLSWRGWQVLGRMSLSIYLIHWLWAVQLLGVRPYLSPVSISEIGGHYLWTTFSSYWFALALHLFIETPAQKFLQALF